MRSATVVGHVDMPACEHSSKQIIRGVVPILCAVVLYGCMVFHRRSVNLQGDEVARTFIFATVFTLVIAQTVFAWTCYSFLGSLVRKWRWIFGCLLAIGGGQVAWSTHRLAVILAARRVSPLSVVSEHKAHWQILPFVAVSLCAFIVVYTFREILRRGRAGAFIHNEHGGRREAANK